MPNPTFRLRWPKLLLAGLAGSALLLGLLYLALNRWFPPQRLAALLSAQVSAATGRDFAVRGALSIRVLPRPGVVASDVVLGNAPWGTRQEMLRVGQASFDIAVWPLLQGRVDIDRAAFSGVDLLLETDRNGVGNWVMSGLAGAQAAPGAGGSSPLRIRLSRIALADARLAYRDARSGATHSLLLQALELDAAGDGHRLDARFDTNGQPWQLKGQVGSLAELSANQADWPFDLQLGSDGALLVAKGLLRRGALPRPIEADLQARLTRAEALSPWLTHAARVPLPIELKGRLSYAAQSLRIDGLQGSVAQQQISGQLKAQGGNPWKIDAQLASPSIDLAHWLPPRPAAPAALAGEGRRVFRTAPLGLEALPTGPATLALRVDRLLAPGLPPLSNLNAQFNAQPGRFKADPVSFGMAGGTRAASRGHAARAPRVALQAQGSNLSLDELLQASGHSAFTKGGQAQLRADLNGTGDSPRALAASAHGELMLSLTQTTLGSGVPLLGADLLAKVLQAVGQQPKQPTSSRVQCAVLRLPLKNGVARVDRSIAMETDQLALSAKGEIRLSDETLTLAFRPSPKGGIKLNPVDVAQLVVLQGPWADPKLALDAQGVVGMAASMGLAGATGGLSLLGQQLLKAAPETDVCRAAMGGPATAPAGAPAAPSPSQPAQGLPQALPDALRKIFK